MTTNGSAVMDNKGILVGINGNLGNSTRENLGLCGITFP
jgi:hypothetical protein